MTKIVRPVGPAGVLDRVQRLSHGSVADRVHVHLEPGGVQRGHGLGQRLRIEVQTTSFVRRPPVGPEVRLEQTGGLGGIRRGDAHRRQAHRREVACVLGHRVVPRRLAPFVGHEELDVERRQRRFVKRQRVFNIAHGQDNVVDHIVPLKLPASR